MILGILLMVIGMILVARNRNLAILFARETHGHHWDFTTSIARQNIAIVGTVFILGGLVFFLLL